MIERVKIIDYWKVRRDINEVGLDELRRYVRKHHPRAVDKMETQIAMLKSTLADGPQAAGVLFGVNQTTCANNVGRWWGYAKEALKERDGK